MIARESRLGPRLLVAAAMMAALCLGGCGRKGPLDAPPSAALADPAPANAAPAASQGTEERTLFSDPNRGTSGSDLTAPKGQKKRIPLDVLLD